MILFLYACTDKPAETGDTGDTGETEETDSGETQETDTGETDETGDTGSKTAECLRGRLGEALVTGGTYAGTEQLYCVGDEGDGKDVCRIELEVSAPSAVEGCTVGYFVCDFAFELEVTAATVLTDTNACTTTWGYDGSNVASLVGTKLSRGYIGDFYGHAQVLLVDEGSGWDAVGFASFDADTSTFSYDWEDGLVPY